MTTKLIELAIAEPTRHEGDPSSAAPWGPVPVTVEIRAPIPSFGGDDGWRERSGAFYDEQAGALAEALHRSIPAGTLDRLLVKLLEVQACHLRGTRC